MLNYWGIQIGWKARCLKIQVISVVVMAVITDLPDALVQQCLVRVPYMSHRNLKAVCRSWKAMLGDPKFYSDRKLYAKSNQLLCFLKIRNKTPVVNEIIVHDPAEGTSESIPLDISHCGGIYMYLKFVCVNRKLVLLDGWQRANLKKTKSICIYDFVSAKWSRGADIPTLRSLYAYAACSSTGRIYVAGGYDGQDNPLATAEAYDVEEDKWEVLPPMSEQRIKSGGVCTEGKFMVLGGANDRSAEVYDPREGTWTRLEGMWSLGGRANSSVPSFCSGQLHALHTRFAHHKLTVWVMKYESAKNVWTKVALASSLPRSPRFRNITQWHDWMVFSLKINTCYLVHLLTGENITVPNMFELSDQDFVHGVTTLEI